MNHEGGVVNMLLDVLGWGGKGGGERQNWLDELRATVQSQ